MAKTITTSIVVQFSKGETSGVLVVEVDDREDGLNLGKTSFLPGDPVFLLRYMSSNVTLDATQVSLGSIASSGGLITITKTEDITFANETEATTKYPITAITGTEWIGADLGTVSKVGDNTVRIPAPATGTYAVGIARLTYTTKAQAYKITHSDPGLTEYSIVAFFAGHTP